ncbi:MAM and LDL-receptor class A domain-containing protein 1-like [Corticium candelabrum]|uniref:MAM and LDL-receptor class A domain-containing protein 1-like n=1 Tax=Corticium candelabrum TaxID=121492 RepID=UPI002E26D995|nr:MAM and LDL-receptor class A domain-containing protein 1-like [Corticium candelabrum]
MAYHMYGSQIGKLEVIAHTTYRNSSVWSRFGSQRNSWLTTTVDFGSITGSFEIYVRASHSYGSKGDIALDDLSLTNCPPGFPLLPPTSFPPQPFPNTKCSFETNLCAWSNDVSNDVDWVMRQGRTPSSQTGPTDDHTYQNRRGKYIYFEVTGASYSSHAVLVSPEYLKSGSACRLQFAYHFYGSNIGDMHVYFVTNGNGKIHNLWSTRGNQGNAWQMRSVFIGPQTDFKIYFNGTHYSGSKGDMALDDISFLGCDPNTLVPTTDWWWWHTTTAYPHHWRWRYTTSPPGKDDKSATPIIVGVTVSVISAVLVFVIVLIVIILVRRRQATTSTTTTTSAQVSAGQPAQLIFVPSAYLNVTYPSLQFNSNELGAPPSYETVIGYRSDSQTVNFGEMNQQYVA